jgi:hypothetical protein
LAFSNQWSLGAEYLYVDLGDTTLALAASVPGSTATRSSGVRLLRRQPPGSQAAAARSNHPNKRTLADNGHALRRVLCLASLYAWHIEEGRPLSFTDIRYGAV